MLASGGQQDFQSLVLSCNKDGMESLRKGHSKAAFEQFKYAEAILIANQPEGDNTQLLAVTCNNLGCYYKKVGKYHGALSYLRRALKMEVDLGTDEVTVAGTHLNICAILSKLEKHDKAVQHALCALDLVHKRVEACEPEAVSQDDYSVLAIAYHNVAVERDFLHQYEKAAEAFQQGHEVAKKCLGEDHPLAITLGKNGQSVLQKSQKLTKTAPTSVGAKASFMKESESAKLADAAAGTLPALPGAQKASGPDEESLPLPGNSVRQDAAEWVAGGESFAFAQSTPGGDKDATASHTLRLAPAGVEERVGALVAPSQRASEALRSQAREIDLSELGGSAPAKLGTAAALAKTVDERPDALMDLVAAEKTGNAVGNIRSAPHDYRPNRMIKGSTRTARVVRRTGLSNSTAHRDKVVAGRQLTVAGQQKSEYVRKLAAERIQRAWRAWYKYCNENADWMTMTWLAATMIQANWRSYHVRRVKMDMAAKCIQRHMRGYLVRRVLRKRAAAVTIQRHVIGMLTRMQLRRLTLRVLKIQCLVRGGVSRIKTRRRRKFLTKTATTIQCAVRAHFAYRRVQGLREQRNKAQARQKAATDIQRLARGHLGRKRHTAFKHKYMADLQQHKAATKLQAMARRNDAIKRVDGLRAQKLEQMNKAATFLRKMWLGARTRRRYKELMGEFMAHERHIINIQRIARGFLVRLRMWREAIRMEERLWAALEIQRCWRGYIGRVAWESKFEEVWRREMAAAMITRNIRGWLARQRVGRTRRRIARQEFERARLRFRSAQKIQALARGVLSRKRTRAKRNRVVKAVTHIQRIARGHSLRQRLWVQAVGLRATAIQALARGFLVRNRRFHLIAKVICIQRSWRQARKRPQEVKENAYAARALRKKQASVIQQKVRERQEAKEVGRALAEDAAKAAPNA